MFHSFRSFTEELGKGDKSWLRGERRDGFRLQKNKTIVILLQINIWRRKREKEGYKRQIKKHLKEEDI